MLKRAYVEITNICNLHCAFCPGTRRAPRTMTADEFSLVCTRIAPHVKYIYLHIMGEPLLHPQLAQFLEIAAAHDLRVCVTTNGTLLASRGDALLEAAALHKVSVSLHSFEGNEREDGLQSYLSDAWDFASAAAARGIICALRLWNEGALDARNGEILDFLREKTGAAEWETVRDGSRKLAERIYLENAARFDWPDLDAPERSTEFCLALREQFGVLVDGTVVPCCLDHEGDLALGNIFAQPLDEILRSPRAAAIYDGFSRRQPCEELCRRCGYAARF
ncbi:MAG: SPASM domain-containing protein [Oscillospiraceae bacterium]|nr:SPASM domain-containing protein [Oscillospiraceae bacterium]